MSSRLPKGLTHPASAGGAPRAADDAENRVERADRAVPPLAEEVASVRGRTRSTLARKGKRVRGRKRTVIRARKVRRSRA